MADRVCYWNEFLLATDNSENFLSIQIIVWYSLYESHRAWMANRFGQQINTANLAPKWCLSVIRYAMWPAIEPDQCQSVLPVLSSWYSAFCQLILNQFPSSYPAWCTRSTSTICEAHIGCFFLQKTKFCISVAQCVQLKSASTTRIFRSN